MFDFEKIQPGSWANISTSMGFGYESQTYENNPVFVMSHESWNERTFMLLDKEHNLLVWREDRGNKFSPMGTIHTKTSLENMKEFTAIKSEEVDSKTMDSMIKKAEEIRGNFLGKTPDLEKFFFA